jgi:Tol biopolymer transport system component
MDTTPFPKRTVLLVVGLLLATMGFFVAGCDMLGGENTDDGYGIGCPPNCEEPIFRSVDRFPSWSPDSTRIAYYHISQEEDERSGIWILNLKTGKQEFLVQGRHSTWGPEGNQLAFTRDRDIYRIDLSSRAVQKLTECGSCGAPAWSPTGQYIAFGAGEGFTGSEDSVGTWLMHPDGSGKEYLRRGSSTAWSAKAKYLAFPVNEGNVARYNVKESRAEVLTDVGRVSAGNPAWSPTGEVIVWDSNGEGADPNNGIWIAGADGTSARPLIPHGFDADWSPDGSKLVFQYVYSGDHPALREGQEVSTLAVANADGSNIRPLTRLSDYVPK